MSEASQQHHRVGEPKAVAAQAGTPGTAGELSAAAETPLTPESGAVAGQPEFESLAGIAPDFTDGVDSAEYIRRRWAGEPQPPPVCTGSGTLMTDGRGTYSQLPSEGRCGICGQTVPIDTRTWAVLTHAWRPALSGMDPQAVGELIAAARQVAVDHDLQIRGNVARGYVQHWATLRAALAALDKE